MFEQLLEGKASVALSQLTFQLQESVYSQWTEDYTICLVSFVNSILFHTLVYLVISPLISRTFKSYREGSEETKIEWNSRMVSNVHAVLYVLLSCYCILIENAFPTFSMDEATKMSRFAVCYAGGYFLYDLVLIFRYPSKFSSFIECNGLLYSPINYYLHQS